MKLIIKGLWPFAVIIAMLLITVVLCVIFRDWRGVSHCGCIIVLVSVIAYQHHKIIKLDRINDFLIFGLTAISRKLAKNEKKEKEPEKPEENGSDI